MINVTVRSIIWRITISVVWLLAVHISALPEPTWAKGPAPKRISADRSTSTCIGDISDPVCAVETWIACYARGNPDLCALLGVKGMRFDREGMVDAYEYWIVDVIPVSKQRIGSKQKGMNWFKQGYIEIRTMKRWGATKDILKFSFSPSVYYLKRIQGKWQLAAWTNDVSVTCEYPETNNPSCKLYFWDDDTPWVHDQSVYEKYN